MRKNRENVPHHRAEHPKVCRSLHETRHPGEDEASQRNRKHAFHSVAEKRQRRRLFAVGAKHVGGAGVAAAVGTHVIVIEQPGDEQRIVDAAQQIGEEKRENQPPADEKRGALLIHQRRHRPVKKIEPVINAENQKHGIPPFILCGRSRRRRLPVDKGNDKRGFPDALRQHEGARAPRKTPPWRQAPR